eukprot:TRINITY_DN27595_c0_g1_i2.p1 TRINITY_DN27595_c0_g1~~TRINITY_DN27595_c0_g1_i2.p1  ORF type:complete len:836 (-),score=225.96 TRINITY_DN27595_c0_g1_i2:438-2945(-)
MLSRKEISASTDRHLAASTGELELAIHGTEHAIQELSNYHTIVSQEGRELESSQTMVACRAHREEQARGGIGSVLHEITELRKTRPKSERVNDPADHVLRVFARRQTGAKYHFHAEKISRAKMAIEKLRGELERQLKLKRRARWVDEQALSTEMVDKPAKSFRGSRELLISQSPTSPSSWVTDVKTLFKKIKLELGRSASVRAKATEYSTDHVAHQNSTRNKLLEALNQQLSDLTGQIDELQTARLASIKDHQADMDEMAQLKLLEAELETNQRAAQNRLKARESRPASEQINDVAQRGLQKEVESLGLEKLKLDARRRKLRKNAGKLAESIKALGIQIGTKQQCLEIEQKCVGLLTMHQRRALRFWESKNRSLAQGFNGWKHIVLEKQQGVDRAAVNSLVSFIMASREASVGGERSVSVGALRKLHSTPLEKFAEWLVGTVAHPKWDKVKKFDSDSSGVLGHKELTMAVTQYLESSEETSAELLEQLAAAREQEGDTITGATDKPSPRNEVSISKLRAILKSKNFSWHRLHTTMDADRSDTLTCLEFNRGLAAVGLNWGLRDIQDLFDEMDTDHSGFIDPIELQTQLYGTTDPGKQVPASPSSQVPSTSKQHRKQLARDKAKNMAQANAQKRSVEEAVADMQLAMGLEVHVVLAPHRQFLRCAFSSLDPNATAAIPLDNMGRFDTITEEQQRNLFDAMSCANMDNDQISLDEFMGFWEAQAGVMGWDSCHQLVQQLVHRKHTGLAMLKNVWLTLAEKLISEINQDGYVAHDRLVAWAQQNQGMARSLIPNSLSVDEWETYNEFFNIQQRPDWTGMPAQEFTEIYMEAMENAYFA